jgi:hypothetical protein
MAKKNGLKQISTETMQIVTSEWRNYLITLLLIVATLSTSVLFYLGLTVHPSLLISAKNVDLFAPGKKSILSKTDISDSMTYLATPIVSGTT